MEGQKHGLFANRSQVDLKDKWRCVVGYCETVFDHPTQEPRKDTHNPFRTPAQLVHIGQPTRTNPTRQSDACKTLNFAARTAPFHSVVQHQPTLCTPLVALCGEAVPLLRLDCVHSTLATNLFKPVPYWRADTFRCHHGPYHHGDGARVLADHRHQTRKCSARRRAPARR